MSAIQDGKTVSVHYTGKLADGTIFDTTDGEDPFEFTLGESDIIEGFEAAIKTMTVGEKKTVTLSPKEAYGERYKDMIVEMPLSEMPNDLELNLGDELEVTGEDDAVFLVTVTEITEDSVTLDGNAPLSGETLTFDLELLEVK